MIDVYVVLEWTEEGMLQPDVVFTNYEAARAYASLHDDRRIYPTEFAGRVEDLDR